MLPGKISITRIAARGVTKSQGKTAEQQMLIENFWG